MNDNCALNADTCSALTLACKEVDKFLYKYKTSVLSKFSNSILIKKSKQEHRLRVPRLDCS